MTPTQLSGRILVTGGTGFVGSHLVSELVKQKLFVATTYIHRDPSSYFFSQNLEKRVAMLPTDVTNFDSLFDTVSKLHIDYIFHLAAQPLVDVAYANPRRTLDSNIMGTVNALECARLLPSVRGVIVASSDKAYGKSNGGKYVESDPLHGDHPYEVSKSAADLICQTYYKTYGVPVVTSRFGNIYGEGDINYSRIIPGIFQAIVTKRPLAIRSNGKYTRDYLYVKDVARGYLLLAKKIHKIKGESFNFGSQDTFTVLELIRLIEKTLQLKIDYKILNTAHNEIPYQSLDYKKITAIGWNPQISMKNVLGDIFSWYKNSLTSQQ